MDKSKDIKHFRDILVYQRAFEAVMTIFQLTKELKDIHWWIKLEGLLDLFAPTFLKPGEKGDILPYSKTKSQIQCKRHQRRNAGWS